MCLGIPGKIVEVSDNEGIRMGKVDFNGIEMDVCLEAVPDAATGMYVIVHAGFAISSLSEAEAKETLDLLEQMDVFGQEEDKNIQ